MMAQSIYCITQHKPTAAELDNYTMVELYALGASLDHLANRGALHDYPIDNLCSKRQNESYIFKESSTKDLRLSLLRATAL